MDLLSLFALWTSKAFDKSGSLYSCETYWIGGCQGFSLCVTKLVRYIMLCLCSVRWGSRPLSYWYGTVLQLVSQCETGRSFVCNIYMDVLIVRLRSSGFGCCVFVVYFGCLMFADDTLLTHSVLSRL